MLACKNCSENVVDHYCSNCGQKASVGRLSIPGLLKDLPHAIFHVDKGFLYNCLQLIKRPGPAIRDYLAGKRRPFFHPASFLVISLVLNYLVAKITDLHFYDEYELETMDAVQAQVIKDYDAMQWWFLEHTYLYILIAIPASTLFLYALFRLLKEKLNLAETAVVILFVIAEGVLIQSLIYLAFGWNPSGEFIRAVEIVNLALLTSYASFAIYQMLVSTGNKVFRLTMALVGGIGLSASWLASAFLLYYLLA